MKVRFTRSMQMSDLNRAINARLASYCGSLKLLLQHVLDENDFANIQPYLNAQIEQIRKQCERDLEAAALFSTNKVAIFKQYLGQLVALVRAYTRWSNKKAYQALCDADALYIWEQDRPDVLETQVDGVTQIDRPLKVLTNSQLTEFQNPENTVWYQALPVWQQKFIKRKFSANVAESTWVPALVRYVPGLANYSAHQTITSTIQHTHYRSAALFPDNVADKTEALRLTTENIKQLIENHGVEQVNNFREVWGIAMPTDFKLPVLLQTYLSPWIIDFESGPASRIRGNENNTKMIEAKDIAANNYQNDGTVQLFTSNHEVNMLRRGAAKAFVASMSHKLNAATKQQQVSKNLITAVKGLCKHLYGGIFLGVLEGIEQTLTNNNQNLIESLKDLKTIVDKFGEDKTEDLKFKRLSLILHALIDYLKLNHDSSVGPANRYKQLFNANLESIIVGQIGGIVQGSCQHGQDRTGAVLLHLDAMLVYYHQYGVLPHYDDASDDREKFVEIFLSLFKNGHHPKNSAASAPGNEGLKHLEQILPDDIYQRICAEETLRTKKDEMYYLANLKYPGLPPVVTMQPLHTSNVVDEGQNTMERHIDDTIHLLTTKKLRIKQKDIQEILKGVIGALIDLKQNPEATPQENIAKFNAICRAFENTVKAAKDNQNLSEFLGGKIQRLVAGCTLGSVKDFLFFKHNAMLEERVSVEVRMSQAPTASSVA